MDGTESQQSLIDGEARVDHDAVLASLRTFNEEYLRRERALVLLAIEWARLNPGLQRTWPDGTPNLSPAGVHPEDLVWEKLSEMGCLHFDNLSIPTFAIAAGISEFQARRLVRESLMLVYLLPRVWRTAQEARVDVWRARKLAEECWDLTPEAIDYVDRLMSLSTARHTDGGREGVIKEARLRFMPEVVEAEESLARDERGFEICTDQASAVGVAYVAGTLDLPDALDLERAVAAGAQMLKELGSAESLSVRRSWALGDIARGAQVGEAPLFGSQNSDRPSLENGPVFRPDCACALGFHPPGRAAPAATTMMYLHLSPDSLVPDCTGNRSVEGLHPQNLALSTPEHSDEGRALPPASGGVVRIDGPAVPRGYAVSSALVQSWLQRPRAGSGHKIIFRPVVDLNEHAHLDAYEVPERLKERVGLRDRTCVFPWCSRRAEMTDCDHILAWRANGQGGPTCSCNLAPLCRTHHRAKTHADNHIGNKYTWWNHESLGEGQYLWRGPKGTVLLRTNAGVVDVTSHGSGEDPDALPGQLAAAERVLSKISATTPQVAAEELQDDEKNLEFPLQPPIYRPPSWRRFADTPDMRGTPSPVKLMSSPADAVLRHQLAWTWLHSTPEQRRIWERDHKLWEKNQQRLPHQSRSGWFQEREQIVGSKVVWYFIPNDD